MTSAIIAGGRDFRFQREHRDYLDDLHRAHGFDEVVCGCARGADTDGETWAMDRNIRVKRFPAEWDRFGKSAGYRRNGQMARYTSDVDDHGLCILFPGGRGTASMRELALARGLTVYEWPNLRPVNR